MMLSNAVSFLLLFPSVYINFSQLKSPCVVPKLVKYEIAIPLKINEKECCCSNLCRIIFGKFLILIYISFLEAHQESMK